MAVPGTPYVDLALPAYTRQRIAKGEAVLFLGSGATLGAVTSAGGKALGAEELKQRLCDKFLGGQAKDRSLASVGDLVKSVAGILEMQQFVADLYANLLPTEAHLLLPLFRWKAIITTNYDQTIEAAYAATKTPLQTVRPVLSDEDPIGSIIAAPDKYVPLIKLHGCVSRATDTKLPLILSSWEYSKFRERRERLFSYLKDWGYEYPIIFCGYSIADENVRDILFELSDPKIAHPRYALVNPGVIAADQAMWSERKIDAVAATFAQLMAYLDREMPGNTRALGFAATGEAGPLSKFIPSKDMPSQDLSSYMSRHLRLIYPGMPSGGVRPDDFYRGVSDSWAWLSDGFDVKRSLVDELILSAVIENEGKAVEPQLHLVLGYAGSGKSVLIKRFAWDVAESFNRPIFFLESGATIDMGMLLELHALIQQTLFVVIDDVIADLDQVSEVLKASRKLGLPLVVVGGARTNEWNVDGGDLVPFVRDSHELLDLNAGEIRSLIEKLRATKCLGYMKEFSDAEAFSYLKSKLENQLLVALHEATSGVSFSDIVESEYVNLVPTEAQRLYLDICTVHRVGVPVRAGTISRISGVRLEDFRERLFKPLEHVVQTKFDPSIADYVYKTRHPKIAEIVFDAAVRDESARSDQLVRLISSMNTGYTTDDQAVVRLIKSKDIAKEFTDKELAYPIFRAAKLAGVNDEVVDQHLAHFEALHPRGDLRKALHLIDEAISKSKNGRPAKSTLHVKALVLRGLARDSATSSVERDKRRHEARLILDRLMLDKRDPHPFVAKANLLLDDLDERLDSDQTQSERVVAELIRDIQAALAASRQLFPRDAFIASVEARFATAMDQHPRATAILEQAHKADPSTAFLAVRLAEKYRSEGRLQDAVAVLGRTLKAGGPSKDVHLAMAETLMAFQPRDAKAIGEHLKRSFTEGDSRYRARFLYARHEYMYGDRLKARREFELLAKERVPPGVSGQSRDAVLAEDGTEMRLVGDVLAAPKDAFCFVRSSQLGDDVFVHRRNFRPGEWEKVQRGARVEFSLSFTLRGPEALLARVL